MSEETERGEAAIGGDAEPQPIQPRDDGSGDQTKGTEFVGGVGGEEQQKDAAERAGQAPAKDDDSQAADGDPDADKG